MPRKRKVSHNENCTDICYEISIPVLKEPAHLNLKNLIKGKENIIKDALGVTSLQISESDGKLTFDWLPPNATQEEIHAVMVLVTKIAELAKCQVKGKMSQKNLIISPNKKGLFCFIMLIIRFYLYKF